MQSHQPQALIAKKIVIVGAGPTGLVLAIMLRKAGVEVTVVEKRKGKYSRAGNINEGVFADIGQRVGQPLKPSKAFHIKDAERDLYKRAKNLEIKFCKEEFIGFENKQLLLKNPITNAIQSMHADLVFDCSGMQRAVINAANQQSPEKPIFSIKTLSKQDYNYCYGRIVFSSRFDMIRFAFIFDNYEKNRKSSLSYNCLNLENPLHRSVLKEFKKLGWNKNSFPYFYFTLANTGKNKINIYSQISATITDVEIQKEWLTLLFKVLTNGEEISFEFQEKDDKESKEGGLVQIRQFSVDIKKTEPIYFSGDRNLPAIIAFGDAERNLPFLSGSGIKATMRKMDIFLASINVENGILKLPTNDYNSLLENLYQFINDQFKDALLNQVDYIKKGEEIAKNYAEKLHKNTLQALKPLLDNSLGFKLQKRDDVDVLMNSINAFTEALDYLNDDNKTLKEKIKNNLSNITQRLKLLGAKYYTEKDYKLAGLFYETVFKIIKTHLDKTPKVELLKLYSNLCNVALKLEDYDQVIIKANVALRKVVPELDQKENELFITKINFYKTKALLAKLNNEIDVEDESLFFIKQMIAEVDTTLDLIRNSKFLQESEKKALAQEIHKIKERFKPKNNNDAIKKEIKQVLDYCKYSGFMVTASKVMKDYDAENDRKSSLTPKK